MSDPKPLGAMLPEELVAAFKAADERGDKAEHDRYLAELQERCDAWNSGRIGSRAQMRAVLWPLLRKVPEFDTTAEQYPDPTTAVLAWNSAIRAAARAVLGPLLAAEKDRWLFIDHDDPVKLIRHWIWCAYCDTVMLSLLGGFVAPVHHKAGRPCPGSGRQCDGQY